MTDLKLSFVISAAIFFLISSVSWAQEDLNEKIKNIEGDVNKITINAGGKEYTFEGDDAKSLFKKLKSENVKVHSYMWHSDDEGEFKFEDGKVIIKDESGNEKIIEIGKGDGEDVLVFISDDEDLDGEMNNLEKKVKVEIEDGNKKVTVTTKENGEEKTEVYEGEEAEKFLEEMKSEHGTDFDIRIEDGNGKKMKKIIIETEEETEADDD